MVAQWCQGPILLILPFLKLVSISRSSLAIQIAFFWKGKGGKAKGSLLSNLEVVQIIVQNVGLWPHLLAEETGKYSL